MRTITTDLYEFNELSEPAKQNARKWYRNRMNEDFSFEADLITEDFHYELEGLGYKKPEVYWSLSSCQGDGVAFDCRLDSDVLHKLAARLCPNNKRLQKIIPYLEGEVRSRGTYYHCNSMEVYVNIQNHSKDSYPKIGKMLEEFEEIILEDVRNTSRKLEKFGYEEIAYYNSDENIDENISNNDYEFTIEGHFYQ